MRQVIGLTVVLIVLAWGQLAQADSVLIKYEGSLVRGGIAGSFVQGEAIFPDNLTDLIAGGSEDWWQSLSFTAFSFQGKRNRLRNIKRVVL